MWPLAAAHNASMSAGLIRAGSRQTAPGSGKGGKAEYRDFRKGDVRHLSLADISKARKLLGYTPEFDVR